MPAEIDMFTRPGLRKRDGSSLTPLIPCSRFLESTLRFAALPLYTSLRIAVFASMKIREYRDRYRYFAEVDLRCYEKEYG